MCYTFKLVNVKSELLPMIIDYNDMYITGRPIQTDFWTDFRKA